MYKALEVEFIISRKMLIMITGDNKKETFLCFTASSSDRLRGSIFQIPRLCENLSSILERNYENSLSRSLGFRNRKLGNAANLPSHMKKLIYSFKEKIKGGEARSVWKPSNWIVLLYLQLLRKTSIATRHANQSIWSYLYSKRKQVAIRGENFHKQSVMEFQPLFEHILLT